MTDANMDANVISTNPEITNTPNILSQDVINDNLFIRDIKGAIEVSNLCLANLQTMITDDELSAIDTYLKGLKSNMEEVNSLIENFDSDIKNMSKFYHTTEDLDYFKEIYKIINPLKEYIEKYKNHCDLVQENIQIYFEVLPHALELLNDFIKKCLNIKEDVEYGINFNQSDFNKLYFEFTGISVCIGNNILKFKNAMGVFHNKIIGVENFTNITNKYIQSLYKEKIDNIIKFSDICIVDLKVIMKNYDLSEINRAIEGVKPNIVNVDNIMESFDVVMQYMRKFYDIQDDFDCFKKKHEIINPLKYYVEEYKKNLDRVQGNIKSCRKEISDMLEILDGFIKKSIKIKGNLENEIKFNKDDLNELYSEFICIHSCVRENINDINDINDDIDVFNNKIIGEENFTNMTNKYIKSIGDNNFFTGIMINFHELLSLKARCQDVGSFDSLPFEEYARLEKAHNVLNKCFDFSFDMIVAKAEKTIISSNTISTTPKSTIYIKLSEDQAYTSPLDTKNNNYVFYFDKIESAI